MTEAVVFDAWAWMEVLAGSRVGAAIRRKYLEDEEVEVFTVDITLAELSARFAAAHQDDAAVVAVDTAVGSSTAILPVTRDDAIQAGLLRRELRSATKRDASLADAVVLSVARNRGARLVSGDGALKDQPDVIGA